MNNVFPNVSQSFYVNNSLFFILLLIRDLCKGRCSVLSGADYTTLVAN